MQAIFLKGDRPFAATAGLHIVGSKDCVELVEVCILIVVDNGLQDSRHGRVQRRLTMLNLTGSLTAFTDCQGRGFDLKTILLLQLMGQLPGTAQIGFCEADTFAMGSNGRGNDVSMRDGCVDMAINESGLLALTHSLQPIF